MSYRRLGTTMLDDSGFNSATLVGSRMAPSSKDRKKANTNIRLIYDSDTSDDDYCTPSTSYLGSLLGSRLRRYGSNHLGNTRKSSLDTDSEMSISSTSEVSSPCSSPPLSAMLIGSDERPLSVNSSSHTTDGQPPQVDSDYDSKSDPDTLSPSPLSESDSQEPIRIDPALLEEKIAKLGLDRYNSTIPSIKLDDYDKQTNGGKSAEEGEGVEELPRPRGPLIRSTSLKTGKSPPNNDSGRKKVVRFADSLGIEIEYVKLISQDEIPTIPKSAFLDLKISPRDTNDNLFSPLSCSPNNNSYDSTSHTVATTRTALFRPPFLSWGSSFQPPSKTLSIDFFQPSSSSNFCNLVRQQNVSLENCEVSTGVGSISVTCYVRVANIAFEKQVIVRHTTTEWQSWTDSRASYLPNSCDGWSDKFVVTFYIRSSTLQSSNSSKQRVLLAIRYLANGVEYWDNNMGANYSLVYR